MQIIFFILCIFFQTNAQKITFTKNKNTNLRVSSTPLTDTKREENKQKLERLKKDISIKMVEFQNEIKNTKKEIEEKFKTLKV
jgi:hypothetical protein